MAACAKKCRGKCAQLTRDPSVHRALQEATAAYEQALLDARDGVEAGGEGVTTLLTAQGLEELFQQTRDAAGVEHGRTLARACAVACEEALSFTPLPPASEGGSAPVSSAAKGEGKVVGGGGDVKPSSVPVARKIVLSSPEGGAAQQQEAAVTSPPPSSTAMAEDEGEADADGGAAAAAGSLSSGGLEEAAAAAPAAQQADTEEVPLSPASDNSATGACGKAETPLPLMSQEF
jgi:hypothetical protein